MLSFLINQFHSTCIVDMLTIPEMVGFLFGFVFKGVLIAIGY